MLDLDAPLPGRIIRYSDADQVGAIATLDGAELRFGRSACVELAPRVGLDVFVTAVGPHPLGGQRAIKVRAAEITEAAARAEADRAAAAQTAAEAADRERRRAAAAPATMPEAIVDRICDAIELVAGELEADARALYDLVEDLRLVGPSLDHVDAILRAIAESPPLTHFGDPGPLVHYVETFPEFRAALFPRARATPTMHFLRMLGRCVNAADGDSDAALVILAGYAADPALPAPLPEEARLFLEA